MNLNLTPQARTIVYVTGLIIAVVTAAALIVLAAVGVADLATVKTIGLWIFGVLGIGGHGLAVANRPTKSTPEA